MSRAVNAGFRIDPSVNARVDRIIGAQRARSPLFPAPERAAVLRAVIEAGLQRFETELALPPLAPSEAVVAGSEPPAAPKARVARR